MLGHREPCGSSRANLILDRSFFAADLRMQHDGEMPRYSDAKRVFQPGAMHDTLRRQEVIALDSRLIGVGTKFERSLRRTEGLAKTGAWTETLEDTESALSVCPDDEIAIERREEILVRTGWPIEWLKASD